MYTNIYLFYLGFFCMEKESPLSTYNCYITYFILCNFHAYYQNLFRIYVIIHSFADHKMATKNYVISLILLLLIVGGFHVFLDNIPANKHLSDIHLMYGPIRNNEEHRFNRNNKSDSDIMDYHFRILTAGSQLYRPPLTKTEIPRLRQQVKDALSFPKVGMILFVLRGFVKFKKSKNPRKTRKWMGGVNNCFCLYLCIIFQKKNRIWCWVGCVWPFHFFSDLWIFLTWQDP